MNFPPNVLAEAESRLFCSAPLNDWFQFKAEPQAGGQTMLTQTAFFEPKGLFGLLYWYAVAPFHHVVFRGMLLGIQREALQIASSRAEA